MMEETKKAVNIYLEANPNPNSLKFVVNFMIVPEGISFDYPDKTSAANSPLAKILFGFEFVERVFFMSNFVTVTKISRYDWAEIQNIIKSTIEDYLREGKQVVDFDKEKEQASNEPSTSNDIEMRIISILDEYIKPAVEQDGGAITFDSFEEGTVKVNLQGSCSGCPSSTVTLKAGIENLLKRMIPEVETVEAMEI